MLAENITADTLVISSSIRALQYFSGIEFKENSGQLVALPASRAEWDRILKENPGPLILQYSRWHSVPYLDPETLSEKETAGALSQTGFTNELTVNRPWFFIDGESASMPVVWIFSRPDSRY